MPNYGPHFVGVSGFASPAADAVVDVIFLHGITGDAYSTWSYADGEDAFWPKWLALDHKEANVYTAGYESALLASVLSGEGSSIIDMATSQLDMLISRSVQAPRIILVAHSLGGLVVKQMLRKCSDSANPKHKAFLAAIKGIAFIGTPHQGAATAKALDLVIRSLLSKSVKQLAYGEEGLIDLSEWFRNWATSSKVSVAAYYEIKKTKGLRIVDKVSANPQVFGCEPVGVEADHISICKPASTEAHLYKSVSAFIAEVIKQAQQNVDKSDARSVATHLVPYENNHGPLKRPAFEFSEHEQLEPDILTDYESFTTTSPDDRRSLAEKLKDSGRVHETRAAERKKERFAMALHRHVAQAAALTKYTKLMADVESRFNRMVLHAIANGASNAEVNKIIQQDVIDSTVRFQRDDGQTVSSALVESALYYLAGNCHLRWDDG